MCLLRLPTFLGQNLVMPQFGKGDDEESKTPKLPLFEPINRKSKLYNMSKNQPFKLIKKGDMRFPCIFDLKKSAVPPLSSLQLELGS